MNLVLNIVLGIVLIINILLMYDMHRTDIRDGNYMRNIFYHIGMYSITLYLLMGGIIVNFVLN